MSSADSTTAAGSGGVATPSTSSLPYSAPHLLKQLTSSSTPSGSSPAHIIVTTSSMGVTRPSPCSSNSVSAVPRKRLKLDMDAANNRGNNSSSRKRLLEKRQARLKRVTESYKDNISELFFLQSHGNVVDLPAFRKKPSEEFLSFLASQKAPAHVLADVRLTVFGPNSQSAAVAAAAATIGNGGGRVTVSSAAMAAAVVAAQGGTTHWSRTTTTTPSSSSVKTASYSPRSSMVSPVKYGELLTPQPPPLRSTLASYRLASYTKDQLDEKVRQEAWVTRRVADLSREGLWSDRRLPKVCERPRGKTQWDSLLQEMQWLAVDFYQERQWKVAAAKLLAYSAKEYVEQRAEAKAKAEEAKVRRHKKIASYIASQVLLFWNNIALASLRSNNYNYSIAETGVCNLDEDEDDDVCVSDSEEDDDDESTIAEQEAHELEEGHYCTPAQELRLLAEDNSTPLETLLSTDFYSGYTSNNTTSDHDDLSIASSSEEYDEDGDSSVVSSPDEDDNDSEFSEEEEEFVMEDVEKVLPLPLSSKQRKLYDDYLSGPYSRSALENGDALSISTVLNTLRKMCGRPHLMKTNNILLPHQIGGGEEDTIRLPTCFPRVLDNLELPRIVTRASQYEPLAHIDLASLNLVFLTHESTLTAITSDRIRKCCANKSLIEELPQRPPSAPSVPEARLALEIHPATGGAVATPSSSSSTTTSNRITLNSQLVQTINGQHMFLTSSAIKNKRAAAKEEKLGGEAFHQDSLHVIARFNERRCTGMPLYGQDLLDALTVVDTAKPTVKPLNRWRGSGHVACLNASYCTRNVDLENAWPLGKQKRPPHPAKVTATLKKLVGVARQAAIIHSDLYDNYLASTRVESVHLDKATSPNLIVQRMQSQYLPLVNRVLNSRRRQLKEEKDEEVHSKRRCHPPLIRNMSAKLAKLDALLQSFRKRNERALVFCEMPEMISILCSFLHRHHYPFIYLDPVQSVEARLDLLEQFAARPAMLVLLATPDTTPPPPKGVPHVDNVVFFDSNWNNVVPVDSVRWCKQLSSRSQNLTVYRLVCQGTVEDSISIKALQRRLLNSGGEHLMVKGPENGSSVPMWKIKRQTLEALFNPHFGDNGVISAAAAAAAAADDKRKDSNKKIGREAVMEEILGDPETIAQLDWLWSSKHEDNKSKGETVVELSQQLDTDCMDVPNKQKPIERYARGLLTRLLDEMPPKKVVDYLSPLDSEKSKVEWEENYQRELAELAAELDKLERLQPSLTYTREDASRTWHGRDGQPMALWTPPMPSAPSLMDLDTFSVEHHLSFLYQTTLVDESDLPPVYVKKEALKRSHSHFSSLDSIEAKHKIRKEDLANGGGGGPFSSTSMQPSSSMHAPRSLFDRHTALQKQKLKQLQRRNTSTHGGSGSSHHPGSSGPGGVPHNSHPSGINLQAPVAGLRHPLPRPQVEAENAPEWLIQEDFYLLRTVRELQGLQLTLVNASPAHTTNWDLISDMVNAVSRVYRGPRQCRQRYETIVVPREEGRILYDMPQAAASAAASSAFAAMAASSNSKKKKKAQLKLPTAPTKVNRSLKTSQMYGQDKNTSWTSLYSNRFESIKAVANKRSPTTKPLVVNSAQKNSKHAAVLAESGINYDGPLNPIQVAAKRAERIQKEKQRTQQDAAQQLTQQRVAAAQAAANVAKQTAAATARVGVTHVQQQQQQQAVVVGIGQQQQQVLQGRLQGQTVQDLVRSQQPQPPQQSTVVVSSQPPVVSVANLTQSQLLAAQKVVNQAGSVKAGGMITTPTGRPLTPQQVNALRQQALLKRQQQEAANKNRLQGLSPAATAVVAATTSTGQKVSLAVTPAGNVALSTMASTGSMTAGAVTVVTQAMAGQPKAHLIRQLSAGANKGNLRTMTEADMKMLLAKQHQQQQQQQQQMQQGGKTTQVPTSQQGHLTAQILAQHGIHVQQSTTGSGGQVATLVKAVSASGTNQTQSVTIPVTGINLPQMKAAIARGAASGPQAQMQLHLRQQLQLQQRKAAAAAQAQAQGTGQQQKVALGQVVAGSKGGVPQLVVSSAGGQKPQAVTVQQIQQIVKSVQPQQQQQVIPHQAQNTTVQARVIPVSATAGRAPQIQVVAAAPGQTVRAVGAPNVTVDPSGRPTNNASQLANALGSHIRVAAGGGTQQIISQVSAALGGQPVTVAVRTPAGNVITQSQTTTTASKLQVVGMQQQQQQQQNSDQNS